LWRTLFFAFFYGSPFVATTNIGRVPFFNFALSCAARLSVISGFEWLGVVCSWISTIGLPLAQKKEKIQLSYAKPPK